MSIMNRYATSALSKQFKEKAVCEEILIDKQTGEIQVKSADGNIVSYNAMARLGSHVAILSFNSINADNYGNIFEFEPTHIDLPARIGNMNVVDSKTPILCNKWFMVSIDTDKIKPDIILSKLSEVEPIIEMIISYKTGDVTTSSTIMKVLSDFNRTLIVKPELVDEVFITSLRILNNVEGVDEYNILYSILVSME